MKRLLASTLLLFALCGCNKLEAVKNETTEAVTNLQNEAVELKNNVDEKVNQVNTAVDSVTKAVDSMNTAVEDVKAVTK